jgi:hypothetical protein
VEIQERVREHALQHPYPGSSTGATAEELGIEKTKNSKKKKKIYTPFPPAQLPRKVDSLLYISLPFF